MRPRGVTLVELVVVLAIVAIAAAAATPYYREYALNSKLREAGSMMMAMAQAAQSEAIKRNGTVSLVVQTTTVSATEEITSLSVVDQSNPGTAVRTSVLSDRISATNSTINFGGTGAQTPLAGAATVTLGVGMTGVTCTTDVRCPALKVQVGGGMQLCPNKNSC